MLEYAGFATVVVVRQNVLNQVLNACHASGTMPVRLAEGGSFTIAYPLPGTGPQYDVAYQLDLFFGAPVVTLRRADAGAIRVALTFIGSVSLSCDPTPVPGFGVTDATIRFRTEVRARPTVAFQDEGIVVGLDFSQVQIDSLSLHVMEGPDLVDLARALLGSDTYDRTILDAFKNFLRAIGPQETVVTPTILSQVGPLEFTLENPTFRVLDGALLAGVDVAGMTSGSQMWMEDFAGEYDLAVAVHPQVAAAALEALKEDIVTTYDDYTIDSFNYELGDDYIHVWGEATERAVEIVTVDYSIKARPVLTGQHIEFDVFESDVHMPWWAYLLGLVVGLFAIWGLAPLVMFLTVAISITLAAVLQHVAHFIENQATVGIESGMQQARKQQFELPGAPGVRAELDVRELHLGRDGQRLRSNFSLQGSTVHVQAPNRVWARAAEPITCHLYGVPKHYRPEDPDVRVRWQVVARDLADRPGLVLDVIRPIGDPDAFQVTFPNDPQMRSYHVHAAVVHHLADGRTVSLGFDDADVQNYDRLDRRYPYVWWSYEVMVPQHATVSPTGRVVRTEAHPITRQSVIHRTDFPGRCRFADRYTDKAAGRLRYLSELPFPIEELDANRGLVCDYCFYGGPAGTTPKLPAPPP